MDPSIDDVIVVGAGLSGLVATARLVESGLRVRVLEARARVGGRTLTVPLGRGIADLGGQWLSPTQERLRQLADELGLATCPQHREGRTILARGPTRESTWLGRVPGLHALELAWRMRQLERMSRTVPVAEPEMAERAAAWRAETLATWMDAKMRTKRAREVLRLLAGLHLGVEPERVSLLYFLHFLRATSGLLGAAGTGGQRSELRFVAGAQTLCTRLAERIEHTGRGRISLESPVAGIRNGERAVTFAVGDRQLTAERAVLALAPALAELIEVTPPWPQPRQELQQSSSHSSVIKCALAYDTAFWRQSGLSGEAYHLSGPVSAVVDHSTPGTAHDVEQPALMAFLTGDSARAASALTPAERRALVVEQLVALFGPQASQVIDYADKDWPADPLSAGCVGTMGAGAPDGCWPALRQPIGRIHFAGTESAVRWPHYLDGAIEAGERAAAEILAARARSEASSGAFHEPSLTP